MSESKKKLNAFQKQVQSILEGYLITKFLMDSKDTLETCKSFSTLFSSCFPEVPNFVSQNISKGVLEVYFALRVQKYIRSIANFQQDTILVKVCISYGTMA